MTILEYREIQKNNGWKPDQVNYKKYKNIIETYNWDKVHDNTRRCSSLTKEQFKSFCRKFNVGFSLREFRYWVKHHNEENFLELLFCAECGKPLRFSCTHYPHYCSQHCVCISKCTKVNLVETNLKKYGVESYSQTEEFRKRSKETSLRKYGVESYSQTEEFLQKMIATNLKKYGVEHVQQNKEIKRRTIETNLAKYGVEHASQLKEFQDKAKATNLKKYGAESYSQTEEFEERRKATNREKFGCDYASQNEEWKNARRESLLDKYGKPCIFQVEEFRRKREETLLKKYGTIHPLQNAEIKAKQNETILKKFKSSSFFTSDYFKKKIKELFNVDYYTQSEECKEKVYQTKKKHGFFTVSKPEKLFEKMLTVFFPNIIPQYREARYPFHCDFYIPYSDVFIELNLFWTHGDGPFDGRKRQHKETLELWKERAKTSKIYKNAIYTWTVLDKRKHKTAKKHKLYYLDFYTIEDALVWLSTLRDKYYYNHLTFRSKKLNILWKDYEVRRNVIIYCRKNYGLILGELEKSHIEQALKALYHRK